ncbi:hypothetical protein ZIOFF_014104 [Zingiber officinale]|uniref:Uncharacterized protein n=1 Tax=Zingiber officinale TaxID=94328 RepID=A0A8J5I070_ZINOF|nr:hypothetical protein ZIOFF_014104 [Zingiber officinale]
MLLSTSSLMEFSHPCPHSSRRITIHGTFGDYLFLMSIFEQKSAPYIINGIQHEYCYRWWVDVHTQEHTAMEFPVIFCLFFLIHVTS